MRLIDADAIAPKLEGKFNQDYVRYAPTLDAVPVTRCKDCKHWKKGDFQSGHSIDHMEWGGGCPYAQFARYESDFCSRGERRSE